MSTQPIAPPVTDLEIIEALDFDPETPCDSRPEWHARHGAGPAAWLVRITCPGCGVSNLFTPCDGCWKAAQEGPRMLRCKFCRHLAPMTAFYSVVGPLK